MKIEKVKITRVTPVGKAQTYNMEMRGPHHNYFANGILTANSHSVCYAYVAFQTAYLKAHYPAHFYAAVLTNEVDNSDKVLRYSAEAKNNGIRILPPCINESNAGFTAIGTDGIRYGLTAIKGMGQSAVQALIEARGREHFVTVFDVSSRVPSKALNKRTLEGLTAAGALDTFKTDAEMPAHEWRARLQATLDRILEHGTRTQRERELGQTNMFDLMFGNDAGQTAPDPPLTAAKPWTHRELLAAEKASVGFYMSGHPLEEYMPTLKSLGLLPIARLSEMPNGAKVRIGGMVSEFMQRTTKKGSFYSWFRLEDVEGAGVKCVLWPESHSKFGTMCPNDALIHLAGRVDSTGEGIPSVIIDEVHALAGAGAKAAKSLVISLSDHALSHNADLSIEKVQNVLRQTTGMCPVFFDLTLHEHNMTVRLKTSPEYWITPGAKIEDALTAMGCGVEWLNTIPNSGNFM